MPCIRDMDAAGGSKQAESVICLTASHRALLSFKLLSKMGVRNLHSPRLLCSARTAGALHRAASVLSLLVQKHQLTFAPKHWPITRCSPGHSCCCGCQFPHYVTVCVYVCFLPLNCCEVLGTWDSFLLF